MARAPSMSPDERRSAIARAALPVLLQHGRQATTQQIAAAAGIAEGTIFRVFDSKDDVIAATVEAVIDPGGYLAELRAADLGHGLTEDLTCLAQILHDRFATIFALMAALGGGPPPKAAFSHETYGDWRAQATEIMVDAITPYASQLRTSPRDVVRMMRNLLFASHHPHAGGDDRLSPATAVDLTLHGCLTKES